MKISRRQARMLKKRLKPNGWGVRHPRWRPYRHSLSWPTGGPGPIYVYDSWWWGKRRCRWPVRHIDVPEFDPEVQPFKSFGKPSSVFVSNADPDKLYQFPNFSAVNSGLNAFDWEA